MARYSLIRDFIDDPRLDLSSERAQDLVDQISVNPYWILAVIRWKSPVTFSRDIGGSRIGIDNINISDTLEMLIIDDSQNLSTGSTKGNFASSLSAHLPPNRDYAKEILSGDWVFGWIVNDEAKYKDLLFRIKAQQPCNLFDDGLKFIGKVETCRENLVVDENGGMKAIGYDLVATGFSEYNSSIFYNPYLVRKIPTINEIFANLNSSVVELIRQRGEGIDTNLIFPFIIDLLLGKGIPAKFSNPGQKLQIVYGADSTTEAPYAYVVPKEVGALLDREIDSKGTGQLTFADITDTIIGVQRYQNSSVGNGGLGAIFSPDGINSLGFVGNRKTTNFPLLGVFTPTSVTFADKSVWTVLDQFLNHAVNEKFTCLRATANGSVVPTLVARQYPFTTEIGKENADKAGVPATPFLELPRWHLHSPLIRSVNRGRSSAARFNFVMLTGQDLMYVESNSGTKQVVRNLPIYDAADAKRHGLHPYMMSVACNHKDSFNKGPRVWMDLVSDWVINQELTWNGTFTLVGIQAPICIGDNLEFDGVVYHIESVSHSCTQQGGGKKRFTTILQVTHGIAADPQINKAVETDPKVPIGAIGPAAGNDSGGQTHNDAELYYGVRTGERIEGAPEIGDDRSSGVE